MVNHGVEIFEAASWFVSLLQLMIGLRTSFGSNDDAQVNGISQPLLRPNEDRASVLYRAGFFSRMTFSWLNTLLRRGRSRPLELDDIPLIDAEDGAQRNWRKFDDVWRSESTRGRDCLLFSVLFKCHTQEIMLTGFYVLLRTLAVVATPLLLYAFVWYAGQERRSASEGCLLVAVLIATKLVESLAYRHWFFETRRTGMQMRSAVIAAIFRKQLMLSSSGRQNHTTGEVANYIGVDAYRLGDALCGLHQVWSLALQLFLAVGVLFWSLRLGALPGILPLVVMGFLNFPFAKLLQQYQAKFMGAQDGRLRATSEALNNMKIIKLQSWEDKFRGNIETLREGEFNWLKEIQIMKAYGTILYWMSPTVVSAVMFVGTAMMRSVPLDAGTIFTVLGTLRVMSEPVRTLPEVLSTMIQVKISMDRITAFLFEDEIKEDDVKSMPSSEMSGFRVRVRDGNFSWNASGSTPALQCLNLQIPQGAKIAICGPVGAGKTSLLYALLGEIPRTSGSVEICGTIALVAQNSWIQSGTVRDNILFGKTFDLEKYEAAIRCSALDKDIGGFDHGDMTEIGQRGLNLSGGQKQRVQLARAVYADADIYLLDDPFSAVDAHTAAVLFYDCVMSALKKKTVVLVTHQVDFLAYTDRVLVMRDGRITQEGSYRAAKVRDSFRASCQRSPLLYLNIGCLWRQRECRRDQDDEAEPRY